MFPETFISHSDVEFDYCLAGSIAACPLWQQEEASTMNLQVPDELISAYFDGEVTPDERAEVERLLEASPEFRQQLDETSKLSALLHSCPRESAPRDLTANVQKRIQAATLPIPSSIPSSVPGSWRREWTAFGAGILATMASLLVFVVFNQSVMVHTPEPARNLELATRMKVAAPDAEPENLRRFSKVTLRDKSLEDGIALPPTNHPAQPLNERSHDAPEVASSTNDFGAKRLAIVRDNSPPLSRAADPQQAMVADTHLESEQRNQADLVMEQPAPLMNTIQPQSQENFLWSLANGDVVVSKIADPSNTVAVVDLTVVDIERGAEELKVLLQKRSVQQINEGDDAYARKRHESQELAEQRKSKDQVSKEASANLDELQVFYVRAPGDQLAETIDDLVKNHPDIYRNWTPQPPIELPLSASALVENKSRRADANTSPPATTTLNFDQSESIELPKEVNNEADIAVNVLVTRNSLVTSNGERNSYFKANAPVAVNSTLNDSVSRKAESAAGLSGGSPQAGQAESDQLTVAGSKQSYYRVTRENVPMLGVPLAVTGQNTAIPPLMNQMQTLDMKSAALNRYQVLDNTYDRSSKLVRMLIVLRSEHPSAVDPP